MEKLLGEAFLVQGLVVNGVQAPLEIIEAQRFEFVHPLPRRVDR